jgi:N-methylhydantoinase A/oxoprolinase/acetone carboxylase beta subunit
MRFDSIAPHPDRLEQLDSAAVLARYDDLLTTSTAELAGTGVDVNRAHTERAIDLRYIRQGSELTIPVPDNLAGEKLREFLTGAFHQEHERQFGYHRLDSPIVTTSVRLRILIRNNGFRLSDVEHELARSAGGGPAGRRAAYFGGDVGEVDVPVYTRGALVGHRVSGPAIIEEFDTTIVAPPAWIATIGGLGSVVMEREGEGTVGN